ncbi:YqaA family protein [Algihabitans albus]|uniref:YqaA family protein n=1 Tax=Algihabitans albus TaxID=2164067 RepID=UPI000E5D778D|nr:VTT domain-containing protein [Algihabitans albus]
MRRTVLFARRLTRSRHGQAGLFALSAAETVFLPLMLEAIMAPMMLVDRRRAWQTGAIALAGCLAGAVVAYFLGAWLYSWFGQDLVTLVGGEQAFNDFKVFMQTHGFWAIMLAGLTPIPFQIAVLASGVTGYALPGFIAAVLISRGLRYLGMAALVSWLGADAFRAFSRLRRALPWSKKRPSGDEVAQTVPEHGEHQARSTQDATAGEGRVG